MKPAHGELRVFDDLNALAQAGAEFLCEHAVNSKGRFVVSLSGGSTPKPLYERLAQPPLRSRMPWDRVHWTLGDERFVPPFDPASNFGMICGAMLSQAPAPAENIHQVPTEGVTLEESAAQYEKTLKSLYGAERLQSERPLLDFCLLGMGDDGHTASLIPGQPVLEERERWVAGVGHGRAEPRITLTYPALDSSRVLVFLVSGKGKQSILDHVLSGATDVPAARIKPSGQLFWFADRDAAGKWAE